MASPAKRPKSRKPARGATAAAKIADLRAELGARSVHGFVVPRAGLRDFGRFAGDAMKGVLFSAGTAP